jgi:pimeloyl-ACP methyl ester carboxylesterase
MSVVISRVTATPTLATSGSVPGLVDSRFTPEHRGGSGTPLVCVHGIVDTWRTWELVLPALERHHDVLAPTLAGHAGGPAFDGTMTPDTLADGVEQAMDAAGFQNAHIVGNSLGGYVALRLAARGRARTVVALAPAGGWEPDDPSSAVTRDYFVGVRDLARAAAPHADAIVASADGRRRATAYTTINYAHIPAELLAHQIRGVAGCEGLPTLLDLADRDGFPLDAELITCPLRIVWGTADKILRWPSAAVRFQRLLPQADWIELAGVGHCPQLDVPLETSQLILGFTAR